MCQVTKDRIRARDHQAMILFHGELPREEAACGLIQGGSPNGKRRPRTSRCSPASILAQREWTRRVPRENEVRQRARYIRAGVGCSSAKMAVDSHDT